MRKHQYYQPSDYEEMLIAAGWVTIEALDLDYVAYVKIEGECDALDYQDWVSARHEWGALNDEFNALEAEHGIGKVWDIAPEAAGYLCREMERLEYLLGA